MLIGYGGLEMKRWVIMGIIILSLVLVGVTACSGGDQESSTQREAEVVRGDLAVSVSGSGNIETADEVKLTFGTGGRIEDLYVEKGDSVKKGDVLALLDTDDMELAVARAQVALTQTQVAVTQAEVSQQTAEYNLENVTDKKDALELALLNAQISLDTAEYSLEQTQDLYTWSDIKIAQADLDTAEEYLDYALKQLYKYLPEIEGGNYPKIEDEFLRLEGYKVWQERIVHAQARVNTAKQILEAMTAGRDIESVVIKKLQVEAAEKSVAQARKDLDEVAGKLADEIALKELQVESAGQSVEQSKKSVVLAEQSLTQAQKQLDKAVITAPFDGVVASVGVEVGDTVTPVNQIVHLIDTNNVELIVEVDEIDIPGVKMNQEAIIEIDALSDTEFAGKVTAIYPVPILQGGVVLYNVKISLDVPQNSGIKIGMSASVDIIIDERNNVLIVPSRAIRADSQGNTVVEVILDEQIEERIVITGISNGVETEIISGLQEGEIVIERRARS